MQDDWSSYEDLYIEESLFQFRQDGMDNLLNDKTIVIYTVRRENTNERIPFICNNRNFRFKLISIQFHSNVTYSAPLFFLLKGNKL